MWESHPEKGTLTQTERPEEEPPRGRGERRRMGSVGVTGARGQEREGRRANVVECGDHGRNGWVLGLLAACGASPQVRCSGEKRKTEECEQGQRQSPFPLSDQKAGYCPQGLDLPFFYLDTYLGNCSICIYVYKHVFKFLNPNLRIFFPLIIRAWKGGGETQREKLM